MKDREIGLPDISKTVDFVWQDTTGIIPNRSVKENGEIRNRSK